MMMIRNHHPSCSFRAMEKRDCLGFEANKEKLMENRGRKRTESVDQLPSDKRACSSPESNKPPPAVAVGGGGGGGGGGSSTSSLQTHVGSSSEPQDLDMDAASSASVSGRSEGGDTEKDSSTYGSCDSDGLDESEQQRHSSNNNNRTSSVHRRHSGDQERFKEILSSLSDDSDPSKQLIALTELCDVLAFSSENTISSCTADSLSPLLVTLAKHESNPDMMLFAMRAITYLCDLSPRSSGFLVRHDAVPALCSRLIAIEYLDLAEQCLLALEKISHDYPLACLQAGTIMAVLGYIDFFAASVQRVALSVVANICRKLPADTTSQFMEAVPVLCNLLQYEDQKVVETVATCLSRIVERVSSSSEMVEELCKHRLIHQVTNLLSLNNQITLSQQVYTGLIGLLSRLASGSVVAVRTLFELNISSTLKHILSSHGVSHGMSSSLVGGDINPNQVHEVLKLLNVLLPPLVKNHDDALPVSDKENLFKDQPELIRHFGIDILPVLIQVVDCGANLSVCYGCISIINKLVYFSRPDVLLDLLKNTNSTSFLAGVLAKKDHHILISALNIVETILKQLSDVLLNLFVKEGVVYAIDAILTPEKTSRCMFPSSCSTQPSSGPSQKIIARDGGRCLCYTLDIIRPPCSEAGTCKVEKDSVHTLAAHIKKTYLVSDSQNIDIGMTDILQKLRNCCAVLTDTANISVSDGICTEQEDKLFRILCQMIMELNGGEPVSTFEFIESGIVKSLLAYLSNGQYLKGKLVDCRFSCYLLVLKRFVMFASFSLSSMTLHRGDMPLTVLIRKLQTALSALENFPIIHTHISKLRNTYSAIPSGHYSKHPCLKVRFLDEEGEADMCKNKLNVVNVEHFTSFEAIENFIWTNITPSKADQVTPAGQPEDVPSPVPSDVGSPKGKDLDLMETHGVPCALPGMQDAPKPDAHVLPAMDASLQILNSVNENGSSSSSEDGMEDGKCPPSCTDEDTPPKLMFYLDGRQLDHTLTLYQAILQLQMDEENDMTVGPRFWSEVYKVTYRKAAQPDHSITQGCDGGFENSTMQNNPGTLFQNALCFSSTLVSELPGNMEKLNPAAYEVLFLLKILEVLNRSASHLISHERVRAFAEGKVDNMDSLLVKVHTVPKSEFLSSKLTEKLEQQMGDPFAVSSGCMPPWCSQLIDECPFLFSFEARCKYFQLTAFGSSRVQPRSRHQSANDMTNSTTDRRSHDVDMPLVPRKKFRVDRNHILDSAAKMMNHHAHQNVVLEVEYNEEVGTGLGPTMEFYTLVSHEFQKVGLGMWREEYSAPFSEVENSSILVAPLGLFPRPWSSELGPTLDFSEVMNKFVLLGQIVAKALQDGRVLDVPLSKAFYKLLLDQELNIYDIQSIDPVLGRSLIEFQALIDRKKMLDSVSGNSSSVTSLSFRNTRIEDLCLEFTVPGYPDYVFASEQDHHMVNTSNLEEYVSMIVDATLHGGVRRQVEAFKSGFNQVFPITSLKIFTEEEIEHLLCGEQDAWTANELLEHIKFDHGYTASSPPIIYLLEIIQEFEREKRRAFLQFVTGAPRLPHGGLAALNPKMTIVRKHCSEWADGDLPSVMTCANYLKLPSYSSKEIMRERLMYAITEGQGSFHLS